jgi:hypothetical protein
MARDNYPTPIYDHGTDQARARKERYGTHGTSALGRAYATGLLGDEQEAQVRYGAGKRFKRAVERFYGVGRVKCPLAGEARTTGRKIVLAGDPYEQEEWEWVGDKAKALDRAGLRPWIDQLVLDVYADQGPPWMDRLLAGGRDPIDRMLLKHAIEALDLIAPKVAVVGIRVAHA